MEVNREGNGIIKVIRGKKSPKTLYAGSYTSKMKTKDIFKQIKAKNNVAETDAAYKN